MNEGPPTSTKKNKRISLFVPKVKEPYDVRKLYPEDYPDKLNDELQQWRNVLDTLEAEAQAITQRLNDQIEPIEVDTTKVVGSDKDLFDHTLYSDYLNVADKFYRKVACIVELRKREDQKKQRKMQNLYTKSSIIKKLILQDLKKDF